MNRKKFNHLGTIAVFGEHKNSIKVLLILGEFKIKLFKISILSLLL